MGQILMRSLSNNINESFLLPRRLEFSSQLICGCHLKKRKNKSIKLLLFFKKSFKLKLTVFLQLEQNSRLHDGHRTERGSNKLAVDDEGC
jgi:hypothetical protein